MSMRWVVELCPGCWLAPWSGDPGRTLVVENAKQYKSERGAKIALGHARRFRSLDNARVYPNARVYSGTPDMQPGAEVARLRRVYKKKLGEMAQRYHELADSVGKCGSSIVDRCKGCIDLESLVEL